MKILLQREAQTISDRELENNQLYLINLVEKISSVPSSFMITLRRFLLTNHRQNCR